MLNSKADMRDMKEDIDLAIRILDGLYCGLTDDFDNPKARKHDAAMAKSIDYAVKCLYDLKTGDFQPKSDIEKYYQRRMEQTVHVWDYEKRAKEEKARLDALISVQMP